MANSLLNRGQADTEVLDSIVDALNPGVAPPSYMTAAHWIATRRLGYNLLTAPIIISGGAGEAPVPPKQWVQVVLLNCGGPAVAGWAADNPTWWLSVTPVGSAMNNVSTTNTINLSQVVSPAPMEVYQSCNYANGPGVYDNAVFSCTIPGLVPNALHKLRFHLNDSWISGIYLRNFSITTDAETIQIPDFRSTVGINVAQIYESQVTTRVDGTTVVTFTPQFMNSMQGYTALVNGIEVLAWQ